MIQVFPIKAFNDNYIWAIHTAMHSKVIVVDPGDAAPVIEYLTQHGKTLSAILVTHHHWDHTNGIAALKSHFPDCTVYGPKDSPCDLIEVNVGENDTLNFNPLGLSLTVMEVPGHTLDHIAYYNDNMVFCGDTLFNAGCGRLFEGTPKQMFNSLNRLAKLPDHCLVYCTHEYSRANVKFALHLEPQNNQLLAYANKIAKHDEITLPSTIALEKAINPFLRSHLEPIKALLVSQYKIDSNDEVALWHGVRKLKDDF